MNETPQHLRPVLLVRDGQPALWRLAEGPPALAIFSDCPPAVAYADAVSMQSGWQPQTPDPQQTVRLLAACVRGGVRLAALNPSSGSAQRLFDLTQILRDVRQRLRQGETIDFQ